MSKHQIERRIVERPLEVRTNQDGTFGVSGYAAVFDSESYGEVVRSSAFNRSVAQRDDVKLLTNHDGVAMARTKSGTMTLQSDSTGLRFDVPSLDPANPDVQRLVSALGRRDIDQCSFAGYFVDAPTVDGVREVREVQLVDVSIVTTPWYEETSVGLTGNRNVDRELVQIRAMPAEELGLLVRALVEPEPHDDEVPEGCTLVASGTEEPDGSITWVDPEPVRSYTVAEARALLGLDPAA